MSRLIVARSQPPTISSISPLRSPAIGRVRTISIPGQRNVAAGNLLTSALSWNEIDWHALVTGTAFFRRGSLVLRLPICWQSIQKHPGKLHGTGYLFVSFQGGSLVS